MFCGFKGSASGGVSAGNIGHYASEAPDWVTLQKRHPVGTVPSDVSVVPPMFMYFCLLFCNVTRLQTRQSGTRIGAHDTRSVRSKRKRDNSDSGDKRTCFLNVETLDTLILRNRLGITPLLRFLRSTTKR